MFRVSRGTSGARPNMDVVVLVGIILASGVVGFVIGRKR